MISDRLPYRYSSEVRVVLPEERGCVGRCLLNVRVIIVDVGLSHALLHLLIESVRWASLLAVGCIAGRICPI